MCGGCLGRCVAHLIWEWYLDVEVWSVAVAILRESWDRQDSLRQHLDYLVGMVDLFSDSAIAEERREKKAAQVDQLSTIPSLKLSDPREESICAVEIYLHRFVGFF